MKKLIVIFLLFIGLLICNNINAQQKFIPVDLSGRVIKPNYTEVEQILNITNLNNDSSYTVFEMKTFKYFILHIDISGGVIMKIYATNIKTASDTDETIDWIDYSEVLFNSSSITDIKGLYLQDTPIMPLKFMIKIITLDETNISRAYLRRSY